MEKFEPCGCLCPQCLKSELLLSDDEKTIECSDPDCDYRRVIGDFLSNLFELMPKKTASDE